MITENIKSYTDEEVISLINKIVMGEVEAELSDLKSVLAEASGRKLEKTYINIIAERIKEKIQPAPAEAKRRPAPAKEKPEIKEDKKEKKVTFDDVYSFEDEEDDEDEYYEEDYPILSFLSSLYKVFSWVLFGAFIVAGIILSLTMFRGNVVVSVCVMLGAIICAAVSLLFFLGTSENIRIKLDIERHLRKIADND